MPLDDWQFWLVTALALWGVFIVARQVWPAFRARRAGPGPAGHGESARRRRRVALTIERKRID